MFEIVKLSRSIVFTISGSREWSPTSDELYHQQQNKWYPQWCLLPISKLHSILAIANLILFNNNVTISYVQVNSLRLKSSVALKWASKHLWGYHLFCC